jgi:6-phosphogluconolactonase
MTAAPEVVVHSSPDMLAKAAAARLVTRLVDAQAAAGSASVVLTGGGVGTAVLRELRDSPARDAVDWRRVDVWWGDERFVPAADEQRNDLQARQALLNAVPLDPRRVHPCPASEGPLGNDPEAAAEQYARELAAAARPEDHRDVPRFDVLLLGVGPEGHVASILPESPATYDDRSVVAVRGCPKPPPTRLSLTFRAIAAATEVWLAVAGAEKAPAVALALAPSAVPARSRYPPPARTPAAAPSGCSTAPPPAASRPPSPASPPPEPLPPGRRARPPGEQTPRRAGSYPCSLATEACPGSEHLAERLPMAAASGRTRTGRPPDAPTPMKLTPGEGGKRFDHLDGQLLQRQPPAEPPQPRAARARASGNSTRTVTGQGCLDPGQPLEAPG